MPSSLSRPSSDNEPHWDVRWLPFEVSSASVGSEEARLRAGLRPPLKLLGRFSRKQLSQRLSDSEMQQKELTQSG